MIRPAAIHDAGALCSIYNHYVANTTITFEEAVVAPAEMERRIHETLQVLPWLVWEEGGSVLGYAHASPWKARSAYRNSAETTVYLQDGEEGKGAGSQLYQRLVDDLRALGLHAAIGGVALPNPLSVRLHEKLGFRKVAHFEQVGWKFGRWIDVGYWQLLL